MVKKHKNIRIIVDQEEYEFLKKHKGRHTWIAFFLDLIKEVYKDEP